VKRIVSKLLLAPLAALVALSIGAANPADVATAQTPEVFLSTPVSGVVVDRGKQVTFTIDVNNKGKDGKFVDLVLTKAPDGWDPILKDRGFVARQVWVGGERLESVDLQLKVPADAKAQDYEVTLRGTGPGIDSTLKLAVGVKDQPTQGTTFAAQYPTLRGKAGSKFGLQGRPQERLRGGADLRAQLQGPRGLGSVVQALLRGQAGFQHHAEVWQQPGLGCRGGTTRQG